MKVLPADHKTKAAGVAKQLRIRKARELTDAIRRGYDQADRALLEFHRGRYWDAEYPDLETWLAVEFGHSRATYFRQVLTAEINESHARDSHRFSQRDAAIIAKMDAPSRAAFDLLSATEQVNLIAEHRAFYESRKSGDRVPKTPRERAEDWLAKGEKLARLWPDVQESICKKLTELSSLMV